MRVLVIDDDAVLRELLEALLPLDGHTVHSVETGAAGVGELERALDEYDVVLCDLNLPETDPTELGRHLAGIRPAGAVLLAMSATRPRAEVLAPFDGFLQKPFQAGDLAAAVEAAQRGQQRNTELPPKVGVPEPAHDRAGSVGAGPLDEAIFSKLAATLPADQLLELYQMTLQDVAQRVEQMRAAQAAGNQDLLRREAHAVKGGCGMVGAAELRDLAAEAEGGSPESTPPLEDFTLASERLRRILNARLT